MSTTIDFSQARFKHLNWKFRLRSFLDGKEMLSLSQAVSHLDCDLGKWYYSKGKDLYGHFPEMEIFEKEHIELHKKIRTIIELKEACNTEEAEKELLQVNKISDIIIEMLTKSEAKINIAVK